jgi:HSP20 family protein
MTRRDVDKLQEEIEELFADLWQVPRFSGLRRGFRPQLDCFRTDDPRTLHVVVELPGVDPATVEIVSDGGTLLISGVRERPTVPGARYQAMEIEYGNFRRRLELGEEVDASHASAHYERGLLKIELPTAARASRARVSIEVQRR